MTLAVGVLPCRLVLNRSRGELQRFPLERNVIRIGRAPRCEVRIERASLSREHCGLYRRNGVFFVLDTESSSGTYVNNERVSEVALRVGDQLELGNVLLHFEHRGQIEPDAPRHPLLDAICADPDDDKVRLVYADWLAERGDPRGELIHYQVQADRLAVGEPRRHAMEQRIRQLLDAHEQRWVQPLPMFVESWKFHHGFLSEVRVDARAILDDDFLALCRAHPIRSVRFMTGTLTAELRQQLDASSRLDGITTWWTP